MAQEEGPLGIGIIEREENNYGHIYDKGNTKTCGCFHTSFVCDNECVIEYALLSFLYGCVPFFYSRM